MQTGFLDAQDEIAKLQASLILHFLSSPSLSSCHSAFQKCSLLIANCHNSLHLFSDDSSKDTTVNCLKKMILESPVLCASILLHLDSAIPVLLGVCLEHLVGKDFSFFEAVERHAKSSILFL